MSQFVLDLKCLPQESNNLRLQLILQVVDDDDDDNVLQLRSLLDQTQRLEIAVPQYISHSFHRGEVIKIDCLYGGNIQELNVLDIVKLEGDLTLLNDKSNLQLLQSIGGWT